MPVLSGGTPAGTMQEGDNIGNHKRPLVKYGRCLIAQRWDIAPMIAK